MAQPVRVAAAQMGPINEGTSREEVVERMLDLQEQAITEQVDIIAYPEMALTTYFPHDELISQPAVRAAAEGVASSQVRAR